MSTDLNKQDSFALVFWQAEKKFSVVSLKFFEKKNEDDNFEEGEVYKIRYNGKKYNGLVKLIGTSEVCEKALDN